MQKQELVYIMSISGANTVITSDIPPPSQPRVRLIEGNIPREGRIHKSYGQKLVENQWVCKEFTVQLTDEVVGYVPFADKG